MNVTLAEDPADIRYFLEVLQWFCILGLWALVWYLIGRSK